MSGHGRLVATTRVSLSRDGPITATSIIENQPGSSSEDDGLVTPKNLRRKRSTSEPGVIPNAPPHCKHHSLQCSLLNFYHILEDNLTSNIVTHLLDLIESSWELPDGKTPVAIRRPSANPSASTHSTHTLTGQPFLRTMASGGRIQQRQHTFSQKTIIKPENCLPCGNR